MSEVSSWNETDNSNTAAPPDGWPEFMNPSDVNNCARAMMGAIKRWYNTVSAGIANALPLSGGALTGPLTVPGLTSTGQYRCGFRCCRQVATLTAVDTVFARNAASIACDVTAGTSNMSAVNTIYTATSASIGKTSLLPHPSAHRQFMPTLNCPRAATLDVAGGGYTLARSPQPAM